MPGCTSLLPIAFEAPGRARSGPLPAGALHVVVSAPGCLPDSKRVELVAGETAEVELELVPK